MFYIRDVIIDYEKKNWYHLPNNLLEKSKIKVIKKSGV
jgi:hypothetical protein